MTDFHISRLLATIFEILGWLIVILAGVGLLFNASRIDLTVAIIGGIAAAVCGILTIAAAQLMRAQIITAESTEKSALHLAELVKLAKNQQRETARSVQRPTRGAIETASVSSPSPKTRPTSDQGKFLREMNGHHIYKRDGAYYVGDQRFEYLNQAETFAKNHPSE